ncbi:MAG: ABC transporter permease [Candidatus Bathyarchaeia archaeon]
MLQSVKLEGYKRSISKFWSQFSESRMGLLGVAILLFFVFVSVFAEVLAPYPIGPKEGDRKAILKPPSGKYVLGTDELGRDLLSILIHGGRVSLMIGLIATLVTAMIGTFIGVTAGYFGGKTEEILMRFTDVLLVIPGLPLMIVLASILGATYWNMILVIGIRGWTGTARVLRAQVLSLKEKPFVESARAIGASDARIIGRHILPNVLPLIVAQMVLRIGSSILSASSLSFLGLGDPTHLSWGMTLHYAFGVGSLFSNFYWYLVPPGVCIALVVLAFSFVGYAFDQIVNPRIRMR